MPVTTVGSEILVNTTTSGNQSDAQVTTLSGGRFVVTWTDASATGGDTSVWAIRAQVFEAGGSPVGGEILVNSTTNSIQMGPQITALSTGGFAIAWLDFSLTAPDNAGTAVRAQAFSAGGTRVGTEILANTSTAGDQNLPRLAGLSGGGFVITWQDGSQSGGDSDGSAVKGQVFAANGARVGTEFLVNTTTTGNQLAPHVTGLSGGGFVITWEDQSETGDDTSGSAVRAQVFLADGTPSGGEILVNTATAGSQNEIQLTALSGGGFAIAWTDNSGTGGDTSGQAVRAQAFSAAGARVGGEILANSATDNSQSRPAIESLSNGGFVVTWNDASLSGGDTDFYAVRAQVFGAAGTPVGTEILVNTTTERGQFNSQIAPLPDGGFVIVFEDSSESVGDTDGMAVRAQAFSAMGTPIGTEVLVNTTTAGAQNAVQITALPDGGFAVAWADGSQSGGDTSGGAIRAQVFSSGTGAPPPAAPDPASTPAGGGAGNDLASLDANPNTYAAGAGSDWAFGAAGDDTIQGNAGNDSLYGDDGNDLVYGGKDNDQVYGGLGDDRLYGDLGNDTVDGGNGNDTLEGFDGDDRLDGGFGADVLQGSLGADRVDGGEGADTVRGGQGNDVILGGGGNDWLSGDKGDDTITGGAGADIFHTFAGAGVDRINDFNPAEGDRLMLDPGTTYTATQVGSDTVVSIGGGGQVILTGVQVSSLGGDWVFGA